MATATLHVDPPLVEELRALGEAEGKSVDRLASELLAEALAEYRSRPLRAIPFSWTSRPLGAQLEVAETRALYDLLDQGDDPTR